MMNNELKNQLFTNTLECAHNLLSNKLLTMSESIIQYSANKFETVTDQRFKLKFDQIPEKLVELSKKMTSSGCFIAIELIEAEFYFCDYQVRAFLVISNQSNIEKFSHIQLRYTDVTHFAYTSLTDIHTPKYKDFNQSEKSVYLRYSSEDEEI